MRAGAVAAGVAAAGAVAGLAGCAGGDEDVSAEPTNPSAGKLGGKLVLYTSCPESLVNAAVPAFMQESGVAVTVVRGTTAQLHARVAAELAEGAPVADVVWGGDASWYADGAAAAGDVAGGEGAASGPTARFQTYISGENGAMREGCRNVGGVATPVTREVAVIALGPDAPEVAGYEELLGAGGGEVGAAGAAVAASACAYEDPTESEAGLLHLVGLVAGLGEAAGGSADAPWEAAQELLATGVVAAEDEAGDGEAVLRSVVEKGADAGLALEQPCAVAAREGADVRVVYPEEGAAVTCACTAIVRDCDNLAQAQAWVDFVSGVACQQQMAAEAQARPVRGDVGDPEGLPEVGDPVSVARAELLATWASVADGSWEPSAEVGEDSEVPAGAEGEVVETSP